MTPAYRLPSAGGTFFFLSANGKLGVMFLKPTNSAQKLRLNVSRPWKDTNKKAPDPQGPGAF